VAAAGAAADGAVAEAADGAGILTSVAGRASGALDLQRIPIAPIASASSTKATLPERCMVIFSSILMSSWWGAF
jgi:hypothetical protein